MKTPGTRLVLVALLAVLALGGAAWFFLGRTAGQKDPAAAQAPKPALTVSTALPQTSRLPIRLAANGNIAAWQEAIIGTETAGLRLTEVRANVGDRVKAGQVLAVFSTDSVQADVAQARASLAEVQATAADAQANAERARSLQSSGALSSQQINQYLTLEATAKARVQAAQAVLGAQQLRSRQTQVLAPDSGIISARTATQGAVLGNGAELFRLIRQGRLEWRAEVTSAELGRIQPGMPVRLQPANGGEVLGRVRMVAPSVDPLTRAALVYVDLPAMGAGADKDACPAPVVNTAPPPDGRSQAVGGAAPVPGQSETRGRLCRTAGGAAPSGGSAPRAAGSVGATYLAGMFAKGEFELGATDALTAPQQALVVRDGFNYLFVLGDGNRVSQRKVQTGRLAGDRVEVLAGLAATERIVVNGAGFLNDGDLVRISQDGQEKQAFPQVQPASAAIK